MKESEASLRESQQIASMCDWEFDLINNKVKWSENCFVIYGLKPFEIEPSFEYFKSMVHPEDLHIIDKAFENILKFKEPNNTELRINFPDGNFKWLQNNMIPIVKEDKLIALKGTQIDITERKLAEDKISEQMDELKRWNNVLSDREEIIIKVKREVNELLIQAGKPPRYESVT